MTYCASGCTVYGWHLAECDDETCRGCLPREAEHGVLCGRCYASLATNLAGVPILCAHLTEIARLDEQAHAVPITGGPVTHGDPAHRSVLPAALLAADELWSLVTGWAHVVLDEYPTPLRGPNAAPWHGDVVAWMAPHLDWIARQYWAPEIRRELSRDMSTARARWPLPEDVERDRDIPNIRCPRCDGVALRYYPPSVWRQPFAVACGECGHTIDEDEWSRLVDLLARSIGQAA